MQVFLATIIYKYNAFAITDRDEIWRIWFDGYQPLMEKLCNPFPDEYHTVVRLLRAKKDLYK